MIAGSVERRRTSAFDRLALCAVLLLGAAAVDGCRKPQQGVPPRGPNNVSVVTVAPRDVPISAEFVAQTQSSRQVNIQARVSGFLDRRVYTEGSLVKAGQVLFVMDKKPFQAQLDQAKAVVKQQQAAMQTAKANLDRTKPLVKQDALSQKDLDDATGTYQQSVAAVEQAQQQVIQAQLNLSYCTITSPVDGISSFAQQADGTYLSPTNSLLTTVAVLTPMWVNFSISENDWQFITQQIAKGRFKPPPDNSYTVEIILVDGTVFPHTGRITFQQPEYDAQTGTFLVRVSVDNPRGILRPNQYVRVRVVGATRTGAILVPRRAVQQGPKGHFVWVVDADSKVESRPVTVGRWHGEDWFIDEGLAPGERVVVDGALMLTSGAQVVVGETLAGAKAEGAEPAAK